MYRLNSSNFLKLSNKLAKKFIIKNTGWSMNEEVILFKNYKNIFKFIKLNALIKITILQV